MTHSGDYRVRDLAEMCLTLRKDLTITPRHDGDEPGYLIEDKVHATYFCIGVPEYTFIALLDGKTSVRKAVGIASCVDPQSAITEEQAVTIYRWLMDNQLAFTSDSARALPAVTAGTQGGHPSVKQRWNLLFLRVSLGRPEGFLRRILPWTNWLFSWPAGIGAIVLGVLAGSQILTNWDRFVASSRGVLSTERWLWFVISWLAVKVVHELAHGIVCKRHGGHVRDAGVVLILGAPAAFMDVTSSWRFRSKWQRIHTAAAGIYVELLIAAVSAIVWNQLEQGVVSDLCIQVMILTSVGTLLFNANPLMRFDGYYILADLLEIPNLYSESQGYLRHLIRKFVLGVPSNVAWSPRRTIVLAGYGVAAFVWRILVTCSIALAVAGAFRGAGLVIVLVAIALWLIPASIATIKYLIYGTAWEQPRRLRTILVTGAIGGATTGVLMGVPWPGAYRAPALVEFSPLSILRADSDGFVEEVHVSFGQKVEPGQVLVVLENEQLRLEVAELQIRVDQLKCEVRALLYDAKTADSQAALERLSSLERRLREKEEQRKALTLCSPTAGTVISRDLNSLRGTYLKRGAEVLAIGLEDEKELKISIDQEDIDVFSDYLGQAVRVRIRGAAAFATALTKISPRASIQPPSQAFCAPFGGPLPVRVLNSSAAPEEGLPSQYELLAPRFDGNLRLSPELGRLLLAGQRGSVALRASNRSIADHLWSRLRKLFQVHTRGSRELRVKSREPDDITSFWL